MAYVINEPCIGTKDNSCVEVCPVDCIHPTPDEPDYDEVEMLYIDPEECIDCDACVEACRWTPSRPRTWCHPTGSSTSSATPRTTEGATHDRDATRGRRAPVREAASRCRPQPSPGRAQSGRVALKICSDADGLDLVAVDDLADADNLTKLLRCQAARVPLRPRQNGSGGQGPRGCGALTGCRRRDSTPVPRIMIPDYLAWRSGISGWLDTPLDTAAPKPAGHSACPGLTGR